MMQNPVPRGGAIFKEDWWKLYGRLDEDPVAAKLRFPAFHHVAAFMDCALTDKTENDPSALVVLGTWTVPQTGQQAVMLINAWSDRLRINPLVRLVADKCDKYRVDTLVIENKANGHSVEQEIRRLYANSEWSVQFSDPTGLGEKVARAHSVTHLFEEGLIWHPNTDWAQMVIEQMCSFPKAAHDDLVDCMTAGLRYFRERGMLLRRPEARAAEQSLASLARGQVIARPLYDS
jgi:predicted phage terminase large subunit-like protein